MSVRVPSPPSFGDTGGTVIYPFKTKPYKHQFRTLKRALRRGLIALLWEPGTGKTKLIVDWACATFLKDFEEGEKMKVLVVCPLSVVGVWQDEFEIHAPIDYQLRILGRDGMNAPFKKSPKLHIVVTNYDLGWRRKEGIKRWDPDMVIADESHRIKKASTRRSMWMRSLNQQPYRAILTGTPTPKSFLDIYAQWVFLNPKRFGTNIGEFKARYIMFGGYYGYQVIGYRFVTELKKKIGRDASVVNEKTARLNLPKRTYQRIPVVLEDSAKLAYDKMAYEMFLELQSGEIADAKNAAVRILRLQQMTGGWVTSEEGNVHPISQAKLKVCNDLLEDLFYREKRVVVFARFTPEVEALCDLGARHGVPTYRLDGSTRPRDRDHIRRKFQAEDGPSLFVAQIQTGGLGITLHSSHEVLFYSVTYALDDYIQACKRVHRIGQKHPVTYRHLTAVGTVDTDVYAALRRKQDVMNLIMEDPAMLTRGSGMSYDDTSPQKLGGGS